MATLTEDEIKKLVEDTAEAPAGDTLPTDKVLDIKTGDLVKAKTPEQLEAEAQAAEDKASLERDRQAKKDIDALPFEPAALIKAAREQFERRLPERLTNTERTIRQMVAMGEDYAGFQSHSKEERIGRNHKATVQYLRARGFTVTETAIGFDVELNDGA